MAGNLYLLCFLVLFIGFSPHRVLSWRIQNSTNDIGDQCPPSPHPLGMCKSRVAAYGYPCEEYKVTTEDGYILSLKRIPHGLSDADNSTENTRTPVLLFHGLLVMVVLMFGLPTVVEQSPVGTIPPSPQKTRPTGTGHGTNLLLMIFLPYFSLSMIKQEARKSTMSVTHWMKSKLILLAARIFLAETVHLLGYHEFNPVGQVAKEVLSQICTNPEINCYDIFSAVAGPDCCLNTSTTCTFLQHGPQSTSVKNMIHMSQLVRKRAIRKYDYGNQKDNMKHYNQPRPPLYNLSSIPNHIPLFLTHGGQDFLGDVPDTRHLLRTLVRQHDSDNIEVLYMPDYAHGDFIMGYNAPELIYKPMVDFFKRH